MFICIYIFYIYINVYIFIVIFIVFIYTYIYISFFFTGIFQTDLFGNVEFRDNWFSVRGGWWLRHGSDSSRSQLRLQPGDPRFLGGSSERRNPSTSTIIEGGPPKKPIIDGIMGPL